MSPEHVRYCTSGFAFEQGTLLMAMANGMPVVSTPYHFALEVVQDSRGIVIPYKGENGTKLAKALCDLFEDALLREQMVRLPTGYN